MSSHISLLYSNWRSWFAGCASQCQSNRRFKTNPRRWWDMAIRGSTGSVSPCSVWRRDWCLVRVFLLIGQNASLGRPDKSMTPFFFACACGRGKSTGWHL